MEVNLSTILTVAFVIAVTAFVKKQFTLAGWAVLLVAFVIVLLVAAVPLIAVSFPVIAPWVNMVGTVIILFLSAAGSVDFITEIRTK